MTKYLALISFLVISGCSFDEKRELSIVFPATLKINNQTENSITVDHISGTDSAKSGFSLNGGDIAPEQKLTMNITEYVFDDIVSKYYSISGTCGDNTNWEAKGASLKQSSIENTEDWSVTLFIENC